MVTVLVRANIYLLPCLHQEFCQVLLFNTLQVLLLFPVTTGKLRHRAGKQLHPRSHSQCEWWYWDLNQVFTPGFTLLALYHPASSPNVVLNSLFPHRPRQNPQYEFKEAAGNFTPGLAQPGAYYPYEPTLGQYQYDR